MAESLRSVPGNRPGTLLFDSVREVPRIPLVTFGLSLGLFLAITYVLCVSFDLLFPSEAMYPTWQRLLPGFTWLTWWTFCLGLIESFLYAWYVALIFCPIFNFLAARSR